MDKRCIQFARFRLRSMALGMTLVAVVLGLLPLCIGPYQGWIDYYLQEESSQADFDELVKIIQETEVTTIGDDGKPIELNVTFIK